RTDHRMESQELHLSTVFVASIQDEAGAGPLVLRNIRFRIIGDVYHLLRESGRHLRNALMTLGPNPPHLRLFFTGRVVPDDHAIGTAHYVDVARHSQLRGREPAYARVLALN